MTREKETYSIIREKETCRMTFMYIYASLYLSIYIIKHI